MVSKKENEYEVIASWIFDPTKNMFFGNKNDKALFHVIKCKNKDSCTLYCERNHCFHMKPFSGRCPYGNWIRETGFTSRARKFNKWINDRKDKYDVDKEISVASDKMGIVGDYIYFPYAHVTNYSSQSIEEFRGDRIKRELFTPEMIIRVIKLRPQAMFGGEITSYQKESVPKIVKHLIEIFPDLYKEVEGIYPDIINIVNKFTDVGREAKLSTIKHNVDVKVNASDFYFWDGEYLTSDSHAPSFIPAHDEVEIRIRPKRNVVITITDDNQVCDETEFID